MVENLMLICYLRYFIQWSHGFSIFLSLLSTPHLTAACLFEMFQTFLYPSLPSHLLCASCVGSTTNTLHSLLAIFSSGMVVWVGGRWKGLPFGDSTAGRMADHAIALPDLMWWDFVEFWWEKLWDRPRLCLSCCSLKGASKDNCELFWGEWGDMDAVNWSFSFMCWFSSKSPARSIWKATVKEIVEPLRHSPRWLKGVRQTTAITLESSWSFLWTSEFHIRRTARKSCKLFSRVYLTQKGSRGLTDLTQEAVINRRGRSNRTLDNE